LALIEVGEVHVLLFYRSSKRTNANQILAEASKIRELNKGLNFGTLVNEFVAHVHQQNGDARVRACRSDCSRYVRFPVGVVHLAVILFVALQRAGPPREPAEHAGGQETRIEGEILTRRSMSG